MVSRRTRLIEELRQRIESGKISSGQRLPSERQLSEEFEVSRGVVQDALRELESLGLVERLPNCRPIARPKANQTAVPEVHSRRHVAVWMIPDLQDIGGLMLLQGIRSALGNDGFHLLAGGSPNLNKGDSLVNAQLAFLDSIAGNKDVAGAIVWQSGNTPLTRQYERLREASIPVVFVDREPTMEAEADFVAVNHRRAARRAVQHLIDLGHQRIAMAVYETEASSIGDRIEAYRSVLLEAGIEWRDDLLVCFGDQDGKTDEERWENLLRNLLSLESPPTAIFGSNDHVAFHLREAATTLGVRVPEDLSLVGFDWLMRWHPSGGDLTTVAQPFFEIGVAAVQLLLDRIRGSLSAPARHLLLEAPLVVKTSTAPPKALLTLSGR